MSVYNLPEVFVNLFGFFLELQNSHHILFLLRLRVKQLKQLLPLSVFEGTNIPPRGFCSEIVLKNCRSVLAVVRLCSLYPSAAQDNIWKPTAMYRFSGFFWSFISILLKCPTNNNKSSLYSAIRRACVVPPVA